MKSAWRSGISPGCGTTESAAAPTGPWRSGQQSFEDETNDTRPLAFAHDFLVSVEYLDGRAQVDKRAVLSLSRIADGLELAKERQQIFAFHRPFPGQRVRL
jgi:hypothetical protein